jgi:hypothetical protein
MAPYEWVTSRNGAGAPQTCRWVAARSFVDLSLFSSYSCITFYDVELFILNFNSNLHDRLINNNGTGCVTLYTLDLTTVWYVAVFRDIVPCSPMGTDVSEQCITSIFRVESSAEQETGLQQVLRQNPPTLKMEVVHSCETSFHI